MEVNLYRGVLDARDMSDKDFDDAVEAATDKLDDILRPFMQRHGIAVGASAAIMAFTQMQVSAAFTCAATGAEGDVYTWLSRMEALIHALSQKMSARLLETRVSSGERKQ
ncbi:MAG: hypothetical protein KGL39_03955 [Patescibacteria group bacterium]|nr:hypothetical protein [Patescibacteria group bacterium]